MDSARFVELAQAQAAVDYGSSSSVRLANSAADELRAMALAALSSPQETEQLLALLNQPLAASWVAYAALEHGALTEFQRARCMATVQALARSDNLASIGARAWLAEHGCEA